MRISNPDRVYFSARGRDQARPRPLLHERRRRDRPRAARAPVHAAPLPERASTARRSTRSGSRPGRPTGWRPSGSHFPRYDRTADELCVTELADVIWAVQMSTVEFHPVELAPRRRRAARRVADRPRPDARLPASTACAAWPRVAHEVLDELGAVGWPKTSGGSGIHIYVRIEPAHGLRRRAPRRAGVRARGGAPRRPTTRPPPGGARTASPTRCSSTTTRTPATTRSRSAYSVRGVVEGTVSTPITWDELDDVEPQRAHDRHHARALRPARRPARRDRRRACSRSSRCWSGRSATSGRARGPGAARARR